MDLNTQEVHLSHYWNIIYKRWKVAVSILAVVMLGTFLASRFCQAALPVAISDPDRARESQPAHRR